MVLLAALFWAAQSLNPKETAPIQEEFEMPELALTPADTVRWAVIKYKVDSLLARLDTHKFNGCIAISQYGKMFYTRSHGYWDKARKQRVNDRTIFQLGSVAKPFTATAVLQLVERGDILLEDPIRKYLPEFPHDSVRIRHLLTHTSGLADHINDPWYFDKYLPQDVKILTNEYLLKAIAKHKVNLLFKPGFRFRYSNTGYAMLALMVERVSKLSFATYMQRNVFLPAGMNETYVGGWKYEDGIQGLAFPYRNISTYPHSYYQYHDGVVGDKGVYTSAHDLARFDRALYTNKILKQETLEQAYRMQKGRHSHNILYGYGWRIRYGNDTSRIVYHQGFWNSFNPSYFRFTNKGYCLIVLHNNTINFKLGGVIRRISDALVQDSGGEMAFEAETVEPAE